MRIFLTLIRILDRLAIFWLNYKKVLLIPKMPFIETPKKNCTCH